MEDGVITISELKTGDKFTLDMSLREVVFTKLAEPKKFLMEDWFEDEREVYLMEDQIEEDEPLHYAYSLMTLEEGMKANEGKFGKNLVMFDFVGRVVESIEMDDGDDADEEGDTPAASTKPTKKPPLRWLFCFSALVFRDLLSYLMVA